MKTLEDMEELRDLLDKATPGEWEHDHEYICIGDQIIFEPRLYSIQANTDMGLICALRNNAEELLRLAGVGMITEERLNEKFGNNKYSES